jgi:hypothetical protein
LDTQISKTTNINYTGNATTISGQLEVSNFAVNGTGYSAGNFTISSSSKLVASKIEPATGSLELGNLTTPVYISGILYNPFSPTSSFFTQWS